MDQVRFDASRAVKPVYYRAPYPKDLPNNMQVMEFQLAGVEYLLGRDHGLLGDAPGLTKSAQGVMVSNAVEAKRTLVVCFASQTKVLTSRGWCDIVGVNREDLLWDGEQWVKHDGLAYRGMKETIDLAGVSVTPDHTLLSGKEWFPAHHLARDESILARALATGSENLPSQASQSDREVGWGWWKSCARVVLSLTSMGARWFKGVRSNVGHVVGLLSPSVSGLGKSTRTFYRMIKQESDYSKSWMGSCRGAITPLTQGSTLMEAEALKFGLAGGLGFPGAGNGQLANLNGSNISYLYQGGTRRVWNSTALMWIKVMSQVISAGLRGLKTLVTSARCGPCKSASSNLKPVYDLVNAGPKQRFTILTDRGPLIAHNCPASLRLNWEREIWAWSTIENVDTYAVLKSSDGINPHADYNIISYDLLRNDGIMNAIMAELWDHVILDEAHYLKDPQGNNRTKAIIGYRDGDGKFVEGIAAVAGRFSLLSGTILPNQPIECYNAVRLLDWDAIDRMSLDSFRNYYYGLGSGMVRGPYEVEVEGELVVRWGLHRSNEVRNKPRHLRELQERLRSTIMVRRLREQVLHELPPRHWHPVPLAITPAMRKALKGEGWKAAEKLYDLDPTAFDQTIPIDGAISTARRELGEAKAPAIAAYIEDLLAGGVEKVVIGAWHHSVLDYLRGKLERHGLVYMDGSTTPTKKQAVVDAFQLDASIKIILGQMLPLGEGWTLTAAQDMVLAEPYWVPGKNDQLLDRISRMGQVGSYTIGHIPVVPNSLDERVLGTAIVKDQHIFEALDQQD